MLSKHLPLIVLLITSNLFSNNILKIELEKGEKVEETFSAELEDGSLHLLFLKKRKLTYTELRTFFVSSDNVVSELDLAYFDEVPSILSFHKNQGDLFIFTYLEKNFTTLKFNMSTRQVEKKVISGINRPDYVLRSQNQTTLIRRDKENSILTLTQYSNALEPVVEQIEIPKPEDDKTHWVFNNFFIPINTHEFVDRGATNEGKVYLNNNILTFTYRFDKTIKYYSKNLTNGESHQGVFEIASQYTSRNVNSFVFGQSIFRVDSEKEKLTISILDMVSGEEQRILDSDTELAYAFNNSDAKSEYFKEIWKKSYAPTITVNKGVEGNPIIRLASANPESYTYHHDWWFHHFIFQHQMETQMQWQMMQQQAIQSLPRFEPNPEYFESIGVIYEIFESGLSFEFVLDDDFNPLPNGSSETIFQKIDKERYLRPFKDNTYLKNLSGAFTSSQMRYIFYDKTAKTVFLNYQNL